MISCSGFGLPMHAQLLRLFVTPPTDSYCAFDGFLLWFRIAYACPATASLCNRHRPQQNSVVTTYMLTEHLQNTQNTSRYSRFIDTVFPGCFVRRGNPQMSGKVTENSQPAGAMLQEVGSQPPWDRQDLEVGAPESPRFSWAVCFCAGWGLL